MSDHGTHASYVRGCHCDECKQGHREYQRLYDLRRRWPEVYGPSSPYIDAAEVREHLNALSRSGVGRRRIHELTGLSHSAIRDLATGEHQRCLPETARRILSITCRDQAPGGLVDAVETHRLVAEMTDAGVRRYAIAKVIGQSGPALQLGKTSVTRRNADAIQKLHDDLWRAHPIMRGHCRCFGTSDLELRRERNRMEKRAERQRKAVSA